MLRSSKHTQPILPQGRMTSSDLTPADSWCRIWLHPGGTVSFAPHLDGFCTELQTSRASSSEAKRQATAATRRGPGELAASALRPSTRSRSGNGLQVCFAVHSERRASAGSRRLRVASAVPVALFGLNDFDTSSRPTCQDALRLTRLCLSHLRTPSGTSCALRRNSSSIGWRVCTAFVSDDPFTSFPLGKHSCEEA